MAPAPRAETAVRVQKEGLARALRGPLAPAPEEEAAQVRSVVGTAALRSPAEEPPTPLRPALHAN